MFDKNFTFRDIISYLIPGVISLMTAYLFIKERFNFSIIGNEKLTVGNSVILLAIGFFVGFLQSNFFYSWVHNNLYNNQSWLRAIQNPIGFITFCIKKIFKNDYKDKMLLDNATFQEPIKDKIKKNFNKVFELEIEEDKLGTKKDIFYLCLRYAENYGNTEGLRFLKRSYNLALFAIGLLAPLFFFTIYLGLKFNLIILKILFILIVTFWIFRGVTKKYHNYRNGWIMNSYRMFLITSNEMINKEKN